MKFNCYMTDKYQNYRLSALDLTTTAPSDAKITINPQVTYQTIKGFGGAFTEAAAYNLTRINPKLREEALKAYFDPEVGINYTLGRVAINGCDFSLSSYDYIAEHDTALTTFSLERDEKLILPLIQDAYRIAQKPLLLLASPWSPCAWMKDNNSTIRGGHLIFKYYGVWARYFQKFIIEYEKRGCTFFGVTIQNEPAAVQRWDSCEYSSLEEAAFVKTLGPLLKASHPDLELYVWDHNRDIMNERVAPIYQDSEASKYVTGTAIHWYDNEPYANLALHHQLYPDKAILATESCIENGPHIGEYEIGERYGRNIMGDLSNYTIGFIDWNLYLDETGGPNWVNNLCSAPIIVHVNWEQLLYQTSYYYIGHFSKYVVPGSVHIEASVTALPGVTNISFITPDEQIVTVIQNTSENDYVITLNSQTNQQNFKIAKRSIITVVEK